MASVKYKQEFLQALHAEIILRKKYVSSAKIDTIYFGGGTPSLLSSTEINNLFETILKHYALSDDAEITLEANPDDLNSEYLKSLKSSPVNRLSIGVQSFRDEDLKFLNRIHTAAQSIQSIKLALDNNYPNLSIDLIFGIPTQTDSDWQQNLQIFFNLDIPHLSAYGLTVEPKTPLDLFIQKGKIQAVDDGKIADQFNQLLVATEKNNFIHYETSNFCRQPYFARHNTNYWKGGEYIGLGPSAHSYNGRSRQWNVANIKQYSKGINNGAPIVEKEILTTTHMYNEYVMVSLRTMWGVDLKHIISKFGHEYSDYFSNNINHYLNTGDVLQNDSIFTLSNKGKLFTDEITAYLFHESRTIQ